MFDLKITSIGKKCDLKALEAILRKMPGLTANQISMGLKYPPFKVLTTNGAEQAQNMKNTLEKLGAVCAIEDSDITFRRGTEAGKSVNAPGKEDEKKFQWKFLLTILGVVFFFIIATIYFSSTNQESSAQKPQPKQAQMAVASQEQKQVLAQEQADKKKEAAKSAKSRTALKQDLSKNSYDTQAWKELAENLEEEGDTAAARIARASYEKSLRTQKVLASLAKTFGNNVRVEITEGSVYYRTSKDFTESQFYLEAEKLRDSLSIKFPGKRNLVIENYTSNNQVQRVILEPNF